MLASTIIFIGFVIFLILSERGSKNKASVDVAKKSNNGHGENKFSTDKFKNPKYSDLPGNLHHRDD